MGRILSHRLHIAMEIRNKLNTIKTSKTIQYKTILLTTEVHRSIFLMHQLSEEADVNASSYIIYLEWNNESCFIPHR